MSEYGKGGEGRGGREKTESNREKLIAEAHRMFLARAENYRTSSPDLRQAMIDLANAGYKK